MTIQLFQKNLIISERGTILIKNNKTIYNIKPDPVVSVKELQQNLKTGKWEVIRFDNGKEFMRDTLTREYYRPQKGNK